MYGLFMMLFLPLFNSVVNCTSLINPPNANVQLNGVSYQSIAVYTCNIGYMRTQGDMLRTCSAAGTWSGSEPVCSG